MSDAIVKELVEQNKVMAAELASVKGLLAKMPAPGHPSPQSVFGGNIRIGENPLTSRGFSFMKMLGVLTGGIPDSEAKVERDIAQRLQNVYSKSDGGYSPRSKLGVNGFLAPLSTSLMQDSVVDPAFRHEMKALTAAGVSGADLDEMSWINRKRYGSKALSWLTDERGGALVAPPEMGELIELRRNKEALINAGARVVPLPPQGRMKYPRQTAASTAYWVGENSPIGESDIKTGEVNLQAKKLAVLIKMPNELVRFASPAAEALVRDDMTKSLALGLDLAGLEGVGNDNRPEGLLNKSGITRISSSQPNANGDRLVGQDFYRMIAAVEEANAEFEGFVMRPKTLYKAFQLRADAVGQGDNAGPFLFNLIREGNDKAFATIGGYPVTKSTQVSQNQSKGNANNLTYILGGMWSDMLIGMFGAIEFAATGLGDTPFVNDQTWVRGILSADVAVRHEAAFVLMSSLDLSL